MFDEILLRVFWELREASVRVGWLVGDFEKMCKMDKFLYHRKLWEMNVKLLGESKVEKLKNSFVSRPRMSLWMIRAVTVLLLWSCFVHLMALGEMWGPRLFKGWPSCFNHHELSTAAEMTSLPTKIALPPKSKFFRED